MVSCVPDVDVVELSFNIDGLPIHKSTNTSVWPVQCHIDNLPNTTPFIVALWSGTHKPTNDEFLDDFTNELRDLMRTGLQRDDGTKVVVLIKNFICDAPARALVKGTVQFNGRFGCDFCNVQGHYDGRMMFLHTGDSRSNESFRKKTNKEHHKTDPLLLKLDIDMVKQFPLDAMHCVDLGVTKKLLMTWKEGPPNTRISATLMSVLGDYLVSLRPYMPADFNRKPRSTLEVKLWKATEFRTFLLYCGPVVLKYILSPQMYEHFLCLSIAVRMLYMPDIVATAKYSSYAHDLLACFVENTRVLYNDHLLTYNFHCLNHLTDVAKGNGSLQDVTAYKFENNMAQVKRTIRGSSKPIVQLARRLAENNNTHSMLKKPDRSLPKKYECYAIADTKFCVIQAVQQNAGRAQCLVYTKSHSFFSMPCDSKQFGIHQVFNQDSELMYVNLCDLRRKAICFPLSLFRSELATSSVILTLVHSMS